MKFCEYVLVITALIKLSIGFGSNWIVYGSYQLQRSTQTLTWTDAVEWCRQLTGILVYSTNYEQDEGLTDLVTSEVDKFWTPYSTNSSGIPRCEGFCPHDYTPPLATSSANSCVAHVVTKVQVEDTVAINCSDKLLAVCQKIDSLLIFSTTSTTPAVNVSGPMQTLATTSDDRCGYSCLSSAGCRSYTYSFPTCTLYAGYFSGDYHVPESNKTIAQCVPLIESKNGYLSTTERGIGNSVLLTCNGSYTVLGDATVLCQEDGVWSGVPSCTLLNIRACPSGSVSYEGRCYSISETPLPWYLAEVTCEAQGAQLVDIQSEDETNFLDKLLYFRANRTYWTSGTDREQEGFYRWSPFYDSIDYTNWYSSGEPSGIGENCLALQRTFGLQDKGQFYLTDADCLQENPYICVVGRLHLRDVSCVDHSWCRGKSRCASTCRCSSIYSTQVGTDGDANTYCTLGWTEINGYSVTRHPDRVPWNVAEQACKELGATLLTPLNKAISDELYSLLKTTSYIKAPMFWTSMKTSGTGYVEFGDPEFKELTAEDISWKTGISGLDVSGDCLAMEISKLGSRMIGQDCSVKLPFFCKKLKFSERATFQNSTSISLNVTSVSTVKKSEICAVHCFSNPSCTSFQFNAINYTCYTFGNTSATTMLATDYWQINRDCFPLTSVHNGYITTGSGSTAINSSVTYSCDNFYGVPENRSDMILCEDSGQWSSFPLCVFDGPACETDWVRHNSSCYYLKLNPFGWDAAVLDCHSLNAYLVEIETATEMDFLVKFLDHDAGVGAWTGGLDQGLEGWYRWARFYFTAMSFTDWFPGFSGGIMKQPSELYGTTNVSEDCIELRKYFNPSYADRHYFNDENCTRAHPYICETKIFNVGSENCTRYGNSSCKDLSECFEDKCQCPYDTYRQTGQDGLPNTTCDKIQAVGNTGCKSRDDLCFNSSVCETTDICRCPPHLFQNGQDKSMSTTCDPVASGCPDQWKSYDNKCYRMYETTADKEEIYPDQQCIMEGGLLATVSSQGINDFLVSMGGRKNQVVGLDSRYGSFMWADGTPLGSFTNWDVNIGSGLCVQISITGTWIKYDCALNTLPLVCELNTYCIVPPTISFSKNVTLKEYYNVSSSFTYECETGYMISGTHTGRVVCRPAENSFSQWDTPPVCAPILDSVFESLDVSSGIYGLPITSTVTAVDVAACATECYQQTLLPCVAVAFISETNSCQMYTALSTTSLAGYTDLTTVTADFRRRTGCQPVPYVADAAITSSGYNTGNNAMYKCSSITKMRPEDKSTITCQSDGQWDDKPQCYERFETWEVDVWSAFENTPYVMYYHIPTLEDCQMKCIEEQSSRCIALSYMYGRCTLYDRTIGDLTRTGEIYTVSGLVFHYSELKVADVDEFHIYYNTTISGAVKESLPSASLEQCAQECLHRKDYECLSFTYVSASCSLYNIAVEYGVNTLSSASTYLFQRNLECVTPVSPSNMAYNVTIQQTAGRFSPGDRVMFSCTLFGEDLLGYSDGSAWCMPSGKWSRFPVCKNLCPAGWYMKGDNCYRIFDTPVYFWNAYDSCLSYSASILNVQFKTDFTFTAEYKITKSISSDNFWLGLFSDLGVWRWTERYVGNMSVLNEVLNISLLSAGPDLAMTFNLDNMQQTESHINNSAAYICRQAAPRLICPDGWFYFNNSCYNVVLEPAFVTDAETTCSGLGASLASFQTAVDLDMLSWVCESLNVTGGVYTGLYKLADQEWKFSDGSKLNHIVHAANAHTYETESCFVIDGSNTVNITNCTDPMPFICKTSLESVGVAMDYSGVPCSSHSFCAAAGLKCLGSMKNGISYPPTCRPQDCPAQWNYHLGKCFKVETLPTSYSNASATCAKLGGRLASVDSIEKNYFFLEQAYKINQLVTDLWIGNDNYSSILYMNRDPHSQFSNWASFQPAQSGSCAVQSLNLLAHGKWYPMSCTDVFQYICERAERNTSSNEHYYEGCFKLKVQNGYTVPYQTLSTERVKNTTGLTISFCRDHCKEFGYKYSSLYVDFCGCGNFLPSYMRYNDTFCTHPCSGDDQEMCGSSSNALLSVYRTSDDFFPCSPTMATYPGEPNKCYSIGVKPLKWDQALYECAVQGGVLAVIHDTHKQQFLFKQLLLGDYPESSSTFENNAFIGYKGIPLDSDDYRWTFGVDESGFMWQNFFSPFNSSLDSELCVSMTSNLYGEWELHPCDIYESNFICEFQSETSTMSDGDVQQMKFEGDILKDNNNETAPLNVYVTSNHNNQNLHPYSPAYFSSNKKIFSSNFDLQCINNRLLCPNGFTLSFWIFIDQAVSSDLEILTLGDCATTMLYGEGFCVFFSHSASSLVFVDVRDGVVKTAQTDAMTSTWIHLAVIFDEAYNGHIYLNGNRIADFVALTTKLQPTEMTYFDLLLGNWHSVMLEGSSFQLFDVKFQSRPMMWNELYSMYYNYILQLDNTTHSWLNADINAASLFSVTVGPGVAGTGLHFDNFGSIVALSESKQTPAENLELCTEGFTFTLWMKIVQVSSITQILEDGSLLIHVSADNISAEYKKNIQLYSLYAGLNITGKWTHVAVTFDSTEIESLSLYLDGTLAASTNIFQTTTTSSTASGQVILGNGVCPPNWIKAGISCYHVYNNSLSYWDHVAKSQTYGLHLAQINSPQELELYQDLFGSSSQDYFIGMYTDHGTEAGDWFYTPGAKLDQIFFNDSLFVAGDDNMQLQCNTLGCHLTTAGQSVEQIAILELDLPDVALQETFSCPPDWVFWNESCYYSPGVSITQTYFEAQMVCAAQLARLVEVKSQDQHQIVCNILHKMRIPSAFVGVTWENLPDGSKQPSYSDFRPADFIHWAAGVTEPTTDNCTAMICTEKECTYAQSLCIDNRQVVCQKPAAAACTPGWRRVGDVCYFKFVEQIATTITSQYCRDAGFQPVIFNSDSHAEDLIISLGIGVTEYCLTDAVLNNDTMSYIWASSGNVTYFNETWKGARAEACISLTSFNNIKGPVEKCNTPCVICQYEVNTDFFVDRVHFYTNALNESQIEKDRIDSYAGLSTMKLYCSLSVTSLVDNSVVCNLTTTATGAVSVLNMNINGTATEIPHYLGTSVLGVDGNLFVQQSPEITSTSCFLDITNCRNGLTVSFWVFIQEPAEYVLFSTNEKGRNGVTVKYRSSILSVSVHEPNFVWDVWSYFAMKDWQHIVVTWHESLGLSLYVNSHLRSTEKTPRQIHPHQTSPDNSLLLILGKTVFTEGGNGTSVNETTFHNGTGLFLKHFAFDENTVWTAREIQRNYGEWDHHYHMSFDEQYEPGWDNMELSLNQTLTGYTWRNAYFKNALFVNNPAGGSTAGLFAEHMLNCFTRLEACSSEFTLSFWVKPIEFTSDQIYITASTKFPQFLHVPSWLFWYEARLDMFRFELYYDKVNMTVGFSMDFLQWTHIVVKSSPSQYKLQLYVNGKEETNFDMIRNSSRLYAPFPFSYLSIGEKGVFEIDDVQFYLKDVEVSDLYEFSGCHEYRLAGFHGNQMLKIRGQDGQTFSIICDFQTDLLEGIALMNHDKMGSINLTMQGPWTHNLSYSLSLDNMRQVKSISQYCYQNASYTCQNADLFGPGGSGLTWKDIDGNDHAYWAGGKASVSASCACYMTDSCVANQCNCDNGLSDGVLRDDSGQFTNMSLLPVMEVLIVTSETWEYAALDVGSLVCASIGYDGILFTMEEDVPPTEHNGVLLNIQSPQLATYSSELSGRALQLDGTGFHLTGLNSPCLSNLTLCQFGLTLAMWVNINKLALSDLIILFDFGDVELGNNGLFVNCTNTTLENGVEKVQCFAVVIFETTRWKLVFGLQLNRWIHIAVTWNKYKGMNVYINGHSNSEFNKPVMSDQVAGLENSMYRIDVGQSDNFAGIFGKWLVDDLRLVERDVTETEIRMFFGYDQECAESWVYHNETGLCYHLTSMFELLSHAKAEAVCHDYGGQLVVEKDTEHHDWLVANILQPALPHSYVHLGLMQTSVGGSFRWTDGSLATHLPASMELTVGSSKPLCVVLEQASWRYIGTDCDYAVGALCQRSPRYIPSKELYSGTEIPTYSYSALQTSKQAVDPDGLVGVMINFTMDYASAWLTDECFSNLAFCHNGWSVNLWLSIQTPISVVSPEVLISTQIYDTDYGLIIYGQHTNESVHVVTITVNNCSSETSVTFQTTTFSWTHVYIGIDPDFNIEVFLNGKNNTYSVQTVTNASCNAPTIGDTLPITVGAQFDGLEEISAFIDEMEIFEFTFPDPANDFKNKSQLLPQVVEQNFDRTDYLTLQPTVQRLPGQFGYALYTDGSTNSYASHIGQFAFDCFGSVDFCENGFTMTLWLQPKLNETFSNNGVFSASNAHRGIYIVYTAWASSYWLVVRNNITEFKTKFQLVDNVWSQLLVTYNKITVTLYVNGVGIPVTTQVLLSGSSYPVVQVYFGKAVDGLLSYNGYVGGIDNMYFWQQSVGDDEAFEIYWKSIYVEHPHHWNMDTAASALVQNFGQPPSNVDGAVANAWNFSNHFQCVNLTSELSESDCYIYKDTCVHGFTVSLMLQFIGLNDTNQTILTFGGDIPDGYGLYIQVAPNNESMQFRRYFHVGYKTTNMEYSVWFNLQYQVWTQIIVTFYSRFGLNVLVDGSQAGHSVGSPRTLSTPGGSSSLTFSQSFLIGCSSDAVTTSPNFLLDELHLWDKAWNDTDENSTQVEEWIHYVHKSITSTILQTIPKVDLPSCHDSCSNSNPSCNSYSYCSQSVGGDCDLYTLTVSSTTQLNGTDLCDSFVRIPLKNLDYFLNCFNYGLSAPFISTSANVTNSEECRLFCGVNMHRYAAVFNGMSCLCTDNEWTASISMVNCDIVCGSSSCGGSTAVSVYMATGLKPFVTPSVAITWLNVIILPATVVGENQIVTIQMDVPDGTDAGFKISTGLDIIFTAFLTKSFSYSQHGQYLLTVRALNEISFFDYQMNIYVLLSLSDIFVPSISPQNVSSPINIAVNVTDGTEIMCDIDFGDGTYGNLFKADDSELFLFTVSYAIPAIYDFSVKCYNNLSSVSHSGSIVVQDPISPTTFIVDALQIYPLDVVVTWSLFSGTNVTFVLSLNGIPTDAEVYVFGTLFGSAVISISKYKTVGSYNITLSSSNLVSSVSSTQVIDIQLPISAVILIPNATYYPINSVAQFEIFIPAGSTISLSLTVEPGDALTSTIPNVTTDGHFFFEHNYTMAGMYPIFVMVTNVHGSVSNVTTIYVEVPVSNVNCSVEDSPNPNVVVDVVCTVSSLTEVPTSALATVTFGDGNVQSTFPLTLPSLTQTLSNNYETHGIYNVLLFIQNSVSNISFDYSVQVGGPVTNYAPTINRRFIPFGSPIIITSDIAFGSLVTYKYDFGDGTVVTRPTTYSYPTAQDSMEHVYTETIEYNLLMSAENTFLDFKKESVNFTIKVQERIAGLILLSNSPVRTNISTYFVLDITMVGTDSCYIFDFGDGNLKVFGVASCTERPEYDSLDFEERTEMPMLVYYTYYTEGQFNVTVNSSNEVSWDFTSWSIKVQEFICIEPEVEILGFTRSPTSPVFFKRSQRFTVLSNIATSCTPPVDTAYEWKIQKLDNTTVNPPTNNLPLLTVPSNYLDYGMYKVSLQVSYAHGSDLNTTDTVYIEILSSKLVCEIAEGYLRSVYYMDDLAVDGSNSYDPDEMQGTFQGLVHKWYCRLNNETLPMLDDLPADILSNDTSGCFGNGTGFLSQGTSILTVNHTDLLPTVEYIFTLVILKDTRYAVKEHHVITIENETTHVRIRCVDNCVVKTSHMRPVRFLSACVNCSTNKRNSVTYLWQLFEIDDSGNYITVTGFPSSTVTDPLVNPMQTTGGVEGPYLAVDPGVMEEGKHYRIRLSANAGITEKDVFTNLPPYGGQCTSDNDLGLAFLTMFTFSCTGWLDEEDRPTRNVSYDETLKVPLTYIFAYQVRGSNSSQHVFYEVTGNDVKTPNVVLRSGYKSQNHTIDIFVTITDQLGSSTVANLSVMVVSDPEGNFLKVYSVDQFRRFESEKDISALLIINMGLVEILNEETDNSADDALELRTTVMSHVANHCDWVENPAQVELITDIVNNVLQEPDLLGTDTRGNLVTVYGTLIPSLDRIFAGSTDSLRLQSVSKNLMTGYFDTLLMTKYTSSCTSECSDKKQLSSNLASVFGDRSSLMNMLLKGRVPGETPEAITTSGNRLNFLAMRTDASKLAGQAVQVKGKQVLTMPNLSSKLNIEDDESEVDIEVIESENTEVDDASAQQIDTRTTALTMYNKGMKLPLNGLTEPVSLVLDAPVEVTAVQADLTNSTDTLFYVRVVLQELTSVVVIKFTPDDRNTTFSYYISYNAVPTNVTYDVTGELPNSNYSTDDDDGWTFKLSLTTLPDTTRPSFDSTIEKAVYIGISPEFNVSVMSPLVNVTMFTAGCYYWDGQTQMWSASGITFGPQTSFDKVECLATHTTNFGASFFVPPNTIDFNTVFDKFANLGDNAAVFSTVIVVLCLYLILSIFLRRLDLKDLDKWSVMPLLDNLPSDVYHYQVSVFTGMARNCGTKSKVFFVLGGETSDTEIRCLLDEKKREFTRGSVNSYILSVPASLGPLIFLRIWHDNSGKGVDADWYLNVVVVKDIQTEEKYIFLCDRWLALDKDDGQIERFLAQATKEELEAFSHLVMFKSKRDLTDGHIWFSLLSRPTKSNFSRVQRLSCCASLLFTTMIGNAMWYKTSDGLNTQEVHLGPFTFSPQELTTSIMMSLLVVPVNLVIVTIFRKAPPKPEKKSRASIKPQPEVGATDSPITGTYAANIHEIAISTSAIFTVEKTNPSLISNTQLMDSSQSSTVDLIISDKTKKKGRTLPYWVVYIAWFLVAVSVLLSAFFTILYSLEWGSEKASKWLTAFFLGFLESVLLIQPLKVFAIAIILTLIFHKADHGSEEATGQTNADIMAAIQSAQSRHDVEYAQPVKAAHRKPYTEKPPDVNSLNQAREYRKKQNRLVAILKEIGTYVFYLIVIAIICFESRDAKSFQIVDNMSNMFVKNIKPTRGFEGRLRKKGFEDIESFENFWDWTFDKLLPNLYAQTWYNNNALPSSNMMFLSDLVHYRLGAPRLRQHRVLKNSCLLPPSLLNIITKCFADYGISTYDDMDYDVGWLPLNTSSSSSSSSAAAPWIYRSTLQLTGMPTVGTFATYSGGGYVADLGNDINTARSIIQDLKNNLWLDRQTRALFIEVNVYNPFVNLFCSMSLLIEVPPSGSSIPTSHITPLRLYRYVGPSALFIIFVDLIFVAFTIYFMVMIYKGIKADGRTYFKQFWNCIEILNITTSIIICAFYGVHYIMTNFALSNFEENPGMFINLQRIVMWDEVFSFTQGFLLFFSMLKLLRLIRFNPKITQLSTTLKKAAGPLFNFFIAFMIIFMAFVQFGFLVFGTLNQEYATFLTATETMFSMLLMKVNFDELIGVNVVLGAAFLFLFILLVVFIQLNMLLSILNEVFSEVRADKTCLPDDPAMVDFMMSEFKKLVGVTEKFKGKPNKTPRGPINASNQLERWLDAEKSPRLNMSWMTSPIMNVEHPPLSTNMKQNMQAFVFLKSLRQEMGHEALKFEPKAEDS